MAFGLYIHWPYCQSKCPYCDFNSHVATAISTERWIAAYRHEIRRVADSCPDEILSTIFIGGGTPSLMDPRIVDAIISEATSVWRTTNQLEISMEANPGSVEIDRFRAYSLAGVNRVSLGIQSLNDEHLRLLGRLHGRTEALKAIDVAQNVFARVNVDLIYARQHQTIDAWSGELAEAVALGTGHLSLYQLTIEDGTVFSKRHQAGLLHGLPREDTAVDMFELTQSMCEAAGLPAYEVSNHARPDQECRHNLIYWQGGRYAGIGPGAHGRLYQDGIRRATEAIRDPSAWLTAVETKGTGDLPDILLNSEDEVSEALLMGLRLTTGLDTSQRRSLQVDLDCWTSLNQMIDEGYLVRYGTVIRTTAPGRLLLNSVIGRLLQDIPQP